MLYIIITDFNGITQTQRCLDSLRTICNLDVTIVVVDHGTQNETFEVLSRNFPQVIRVHGAPDLWWAGATNIGIRFALENGAEAVILLNNDCYVTPSTISELVTLWTTHQDAIIAPIQRDWRSGIITTITSSSLFLLGFSSILGTRKLTPTTCAHRLLPTKLIIGGRGVIIPASVFHTVGLFDEENFPHYWADHDFYLRAYQQGVPHYIATRAYVDVDNSRTTIADNPGNLTLGQWIYSLRSIRSHRNLTHVTALFKRHYPFKHVYMLGVALYTGRYFLTYLLRRIAYHLKR